MTEAELLKPYLDRMAERRKWSSPGQALSIARVREIPALLIRQDGLRPFRSGLLTMTSSRSTSTITTRSSVFRTGPRGF